LKVIELQKTGGDKNSPSSEDSPSSLPVQEEARRLNEANDRLRQKNDALRREIQEIREHLQNLRGDE
jgi:FtsZ-binding cell division protein ZapB